MKDFLVAVIISFILMLAIFGLQAGLNRAFPSTEQPTPDPTPTQETGYELNCLEEGHKATVVSANPCMVGSFVQRQYGSTQVIPMGYKSSFYPNFNGSLGGDVVYDSGYSLDLGFWSGEWSLTTEPFLAKAKQCYLMISDFFADVNNGTPQGDKNFELVTNSSLSMSVNTLGERTNIGNHPVVEFLYFHEMLGVGVYDLKGQRRGMSPFWVLEDTEVSAEFSFVTLWPLNIHETRLTFHDAYVVTVPQEDCDGIEGL